MMHMPGHPSSVIASDLTDKIRSFAAAAEALGQLHTEQLAIIYDQGWFNLFVPKRYGGLELTLPEALHIEEALAWADGSTGWTVTLCSGANWFIGFLDPSAAQEIYHNPQVCLAGSGRTSGIARINPDGYTITGQWNYATGSLHATAFTANCMIEKDGTLLQDAAGDPLVYSFWFHKEEVSIIKNWSSIGMVATASHGFEVKEVRVPSNRSFLLEPGKAVLDHPVYHFPFLAFAEATLAVNYSGMAVNFLDLCRDLFEEKLSRPSRSRSTVLPLREILQEAEQELNTARSFFYAAIHSAWETMVSSQSVPDEQLQLISHKSRRLATIARQQVDLLYPFCGIAAADPSTAINRVWRDLHTASQHSLLVFPQS